MKFYLETFKKEGCPEEYFSAYIYTDTRWRNQILLDDWPSDAARYVTLASRPNGEMAGLQNYDIKNGVLLVNAMWVEPRFRGHSLSADMLEVSLATQPIHTVSMYCIHKASVAVAKRVSAAHPELVWNIDVSPYLNAKGKVQ